MAGRERPTLEMVASRAGVSRATVSRVVNGSQTVAPHLREVVMRAVEALGYVPNQAARSLVTQRTDAFALVASEPQSRIFSDDPYFAGVIHGVSQELESAGKQLVLIMAATGASHQRVERYAAGGHVDGVMLFSIHGADPLPNTLLRMGVPVVCNGRPLLPPNQPPPEFGPLPYVDVDNVAGAETAVRYLMEQGRRRIATIAGPQDMVAGVDRLQGYRTVLKDSDRRSIIAVGDFTRESGATAMRQLLADDPGIDAVFAGSDLMADGALRTLKQAGRRVPEDVAVVGFDDNMVAAFADPPLTTVRQPIQEIGRTLARQVLRLAAGEAIEQAKMLPVDLVVREST
ncbi:LacI family DNA-binding transcriptional regulator [Virgisporangium aliadipatigenens]|uniref:LacI family DNA-binding transcriptional regulator n=1 Tax=Virgisporangium aliadipatigenens TaxID=741659 RepID=UPI001941284A|nr:LacI family DNA-binding transcriptional regulator [Virgisporangium aliadipatigenens]